MPARLLTVSMVQATVLFAQGAPPIVGDPTGGWGSLILQGGSFGLVVYLVTVLAPKMFAEGRSERERRDALFSSLVHQMETNFDGRSTKIVEAIQAQTEALQAAQAAGTQKIENALTTACKHKTA